MGLLLRREHVGRQLLTVGLWVTLWGLLVAQTCAPPPIEFIYDTNGRLVAVVDNSTPITGYASNAPDKVAVYNYDAAGNITSITRGPTTTPRLLGVAPLCVLPNTSVTIRGTGFSTTAANNRVTFPGVASPVTPAGAFATQLIVTAPAGVQAGTISVEVLTGSPATWTPASAPSPISLRTDCGAPVITSIGCTSNCVWTPGVTAVTISGVNFATDPALNHLTFNGQTATINSVNASGTQITTVVPSGATSGHVHLQTPRGSTTSADFYYVRPNGYPTVVIEDTKSLVIPSAPSGTPNQVNVTKSINDNTRAALVAFEGIVGAKVLLRVTHVGCDLFWFLPSGLPVTDAFWDGRVIMESGVHLLLISRGLGIGDCVGTITVEAYRADDVVGVIAKDGTPASVSIVAPTQNGQLWFEGTAGARASLTLNGFANAFISILDAAGDVLPGSSTAGGPMIAPTLLPNNQLYSVFVDPPSTITTNVTAHLWDVPPDDINLEIPVQGSAGTQNAPVYIAAPGQTPLIRFQATSTQSLTVRVAWTATTAANFIYNYETQGGAPYFVVDIYQGQLSDVTGHTPWKSSGTFPAENVSPITVNLPSPPIGWYTIRIRHTDSIANNFDGRGGPLNVRVNR